MDMRTKSKQPVQQKPATDLDEVKRRFIRQNRELAKNNSNQSLRIRNLELEVSRLLSDNLELSGDVLRLQNEVYTVRSRATVEAAKRVKDELRAKLAELSGIVDEIEEADDSIISRRDSGEKKPIEGNWRQRQPLTELMRDSQMPTIVEDKMYPRRTLGAEEIQAIRLSDQSSNESPDLGPPPIARFDCDDPAKNISPLVGKISPTDITNGDEDLLPASLSINLETRRKRKDGQSRLDVRRRSLLPQSPAKAEGEPSTILKTGAKRKLADRESERPIKPPSKGDFTFSRKMPTDNSSTSEEAEAGKRQDLEKDEQPEIEAAPIVKPARKILGEKSVNTSPKKPSARSGKPDKDTADKRAKDIGDKSIQSRLTSSRQRRLSSIPLPTPHDEVMQTVEVQPPSVTNTDPPPQTPAALDLFSLTPSEPSARMENQGRDDTPPPSFVNTTSDTGARPSRRARAAVNYAEPSLNTKMRRPDKKMVDALSGLQDHRRAMSGLGERKSLASSTPSDATMIKQEPVDDEEVWRSHVPAIVNAKAFEASSPLSQKGEPESHKPVPSVLTEVITSPPMAEKPSTSSISALLHTGNSRARRESSNQQPLGVDIEESIKVASKKMEELDLYDFKESSSPPDDSRLSQDVKPERKTHRRHSGVPKNVGMKIAVENGPPESRIGGLGGAAKTDQQKERAASRRRSMMV